MGRVWLTELPKALEAGGVKFRTWRGWETRSNRHGGLKELRAIGIHHDVSRPSWDDDRGCRVCWESSKDKPIGNLYLGRGGEWIIGAAGQTNTQGKGGPVNTSKGLISKGIGNAWFLSIEAANNGVDEPWPDVQLDSYVKGVLALMKWYRLEVGDIFAHFEWSNPGKNIRTGGFRKIDPAGPCKYGVPNAAHAHMWNMDAFRGDVWLRSLPAGAGSAAPEAEAVAKLPTAGTADGPTGVRTDWSKIPITDRRVTVMNILTQRYGYPVNGAAGIVGNLEAESGIIPNRVQQSKAGSPMTSPDSKGVITTWTAQQIMDRKEGQSGPKTGGIGLAQWTFPSRREGLFKYGYKGVVLGPKILFDMDAQLDYLVHELRGPNSEWKKVEEALNRPGVTVDDASDVFLEDFERPEVVVNKAKKPAEYQAQVEKRRGMCRAALADYNTDGVNVVSSGSSSTPAVVTPTVVTPVIATLDSATIEQGAENIVIAYIAQPPEGSPPHWPWMVCINGSVRYATSVDARMAIDKGIPFRKLNKEQYDWLRKAAGL